jgi:hypothetical protein
MKLERSALDWRSADRNPTLQIGQTGQPRSRLAVYGMQGSRPVSTLPCPAGRSVPGRGGPERRRRPRPDGTGRAAAPHSRLAHETVVTEDGRTCLTWGGGGGRNCMVRKRSCRIGRLSLLTLDHSPGVASTAGATGTP